MRYGNNQLGLDHRGSRGVFYVVRHDKENFWGIDGEIIEMQVVGKIIQAAER